jgi:hypothetical protein
MYNPVPFSEPRSLAQQIRQCWRATRTAHSNPLFKLSADNATDAQTSVRSFPPTIVAGTRASEPLEWRWMVAHNGIPVKTHSMKSKTLYRRRGFLQGFLRGLNSSSELFRSQVYATGVRSSMMSMQQEWKAIGDDFRSVMSHEYGGTSSSDDR